MRTAHPTTPACLESVEARRMLSSSAPEAKLDHSTLYVRGAEKVGNAITVTQDATAKTLTVTVVYTPAAAKPADDNSSDDSSDDHSGSGGSGGIVSVTPPADPTPVNYTQTFDASNVTMVKVRGGKLADSVSLVSTDPATPFSLNARVNGDKGNDTITTGSGNDRVDGDGGNDVIDTGAGNDLVWGGKGADQLSGGEGKDFLWGGTGDDTLDGGAGDDVIVTLMGSDSVVGGEGTDTFVVKKAKHGHGYGQVKDHGKHDKVQYKTKGGSDTDDAPATA